MQRRVTWALQLVSVRLKMLKMVPSNLEGFKNHKSSPKRKTLTSKLQSELVFSTTTICLL